MSVITPDGQPASMPRSDKRRGRTISDSSARRLRDMYVVMLVKLVGLSVPDAQAVCRSGNLSRSQIHRRLAEYPGDPEQLMHDMLAEARYATHERLGAAKG